MVRHCVVVGGLEVGEMADELLEVESVAMAVLVEHAVHDEVADWVHVDLQYVCGLKSLVKARECSACRRPLLLYKQ